MSHEIDVNFLFVSSPDVLDCKGLQISQGYGTEFSNREQQLQSRVKIQ